MIGLFFLVATAAIFAGLGLAALRWGVDSRAWTRDGRPMTIVR
jgi:nitrogen fixation-related uncharacterized protein